MTVRLAAPETLPEVSVAVALNGTVPAGRPPSTVVGTSIDQSPALDAYFWRVQPSTVRVTVALGSALPETTIGAARSGAVSTSSPAIVNRTGLATTAGYIGVMVPIVALAISSLFEGYRWEWLALAGVAVSVAGNVIILRR